ncbi:MAG: 50S ribosomal protein L23 [Candidatus Micrarchaeota archaeon]
MAETKKVAMPAELASVLLYPLVTEKAVGMIETQNKLSFVVKDSASKIDIKTAIEKQFGAKVINVNVIRDRKGRKKAFVKLDSKSKASDIAIKLGVI